MEHTIITIAIILFLIIVDAASTLMTYGAHLQDTPENRNAIKAVFENTENEYRDGIFHVFSMRQRNIIQYVTKIRSIISYYNVRRLGWVSRFSPLKKYIDGFYKEAQKTAHAKLTKQLTEL